MRDAVLLSPLGALVVGVLVVAVTYSCAKPRRKP